MVSKQLEIVVLIILNRSFHWAQTLHYGSINTTSSEIMEITYLFNIIKRKLIVYINGWHEKVWSMADTNESEVWLRTSSDGSVHVSLLVSGMLFFTCVFSFFRSPDVKYMRTSNKDLPINLIKCHRMLNI